MTCRQQDIRELLPAFIERSLAPGDAERVERHLALCADCTEELALLRMMAEEPVPDPGEAYWSTLPERVHRRFREEQSRNRFSIPWRTLFALPRMTWMSSAALLVAVIVWVSLHPVTKSGDMLDESDQLSLSESLVDGRVEVAELTDHEMTAVTQWAENAYEPIHEAIDEQHLERTDSDLAEELRNLSSEQLDRLLEQLKVKERTSRENIRNENREGIG
jgi:anti-sigma factor RsiW